VSAESVPPNYRTPESAWRVALIAQSYQRLVGRALIDPGAEPVFALWQAPAAVVAHDVEADPLFFFGNRAALAAFDCDVDRFVGMPSRLSA
jgi:hypothetical protein